MANILFHLWRRKTLRTLQKLTESTNSSLLNIKKYQVQKQCFNQCTGSQITNLELSNLTNFDKSSNPNEWYYVERCLSYKIVPTPKQLSNSVLSEWMPPQKKAILHPYFIPRTKNHMIPIYLCISYRGLRHITLIKKIQGNIWKLEEELKMYLKSKSKKYKNVATRVNEMTGQIRFRGDHVEYLKQWMVSKGF